MEAGALPFKYFFGKPCEDAKFLDLKGRRNAEVAELVDAQDLKSCVQQWTCGFDSRLRHHSCTMLLFREISNRCIERCVSRPCRTAHPER
jgi:hypothetical protein